MMVLGLYGGIFTVMKIKSSFAAPPPLTFESKEEEDYVKRYVAHVQAEEHKPQLLRKPYAGVSGL